MDAAERIRLTAVALLRERGSQGTLEPPPELIAKIEAGGLCHCFRSKQKLPFDNFARTIDAPVDAFRHAGAV
jgi:hypothetical protein